MKPLRSSPLVCLLASGFSCAPAAVIAPPAKPSGAAPQEGPLAALPYRPVLDVSAMDKSIDPCVDFYAYSCAGWMKANPIPPDQGSWSVYEKAEDDNQRFLWGVLQAAADASPSRTPPEQKIGDYFAACMDEDAVERAGSTPLKSNLAIIEALTSVKDLPPIVARLQLETLGFFHGNPMFGFRSAQDYDNSSQMIAFVDAGGLGLPDRDYYTRPDARSETLRKQYLAHVARMFQLLGDSPEVAASKASRVFAIETDLAKASLTLVQKRDPHALHHPLSRETLQKLTPSFDWSAFLTAIGVSSVRVLNITEPDFFKEVERTLQTIPLADWKVYLTWHWAHARAPYLSSPFVEADFDFYGRTLRGVRQLRPRWKRCVSWIDHQLTDALGQEFVRRTFTPETRNRALEMTRRIEDAMEQDIHSLSWMGTATKKEALAKLHAIVNKIGYPDHWRDYAELRIARDDFAGNVDRAFAFESRRWMAKIGRPVDHSEWFITPSTVNAYYDAQMNDMNFPAGVLQPPLFDMKLDDAPNYGDTGGTIGHELTHGFDDEGRQFDAGGNLRDWWSPEDAKGFEKRAQCVVDQFGQYTVLDELKINSKLTEGEDVADLGGTMLAYVAWKHATQGSSLTNVEGFTPDQRFFIGYAQWVCENYRPETLRLHTLTNPHSPGKYRINGIVADMPEFQTAFGCKAGQPMVRENRCRVW